jgi:hypothetical protein
VHTLYTMSPMLQEGVQCGSDRCAEYRVGDFSHLLPTTHHPLQAEKFRSKAQKEEVFRSHQQYCRYLYYLGRIRAIQLEYSEARDCLQQVWQRRVFFYTRVRSCFHACVCVGQNCMYIHRIYMVLANLINMALAAARLLACVTLVHTLQS